MNAEEQNAATSQNKKTSQGKNAANKGDWLKHALTSEVLAQCLDWPTITYAETHAGAGIFSADSQANADSKYQHIRKLHAVVSELRDVDPLCHGKISRCDNASFCTSSRAKASPVVL